MNIIRRIKNLWKLSAYKFFEDSAKGYVYKGSGGTFVKDFPTIEKKMATIIKPEVNLFEDETDNTQ